MGIDLTKSAQKIIAREPVTMMYYDEIRKYKPLGQEEERYLIELAQKGDTEARNAIIESQLKFVVAIARRAKTNICLDDLINEGNIGLIKAIDKYDINSGIRFGSYAVNWITKAINDFIVNNEKIVRIKNANKVYYYADAYRKKFFKEFQRYPGDEELREYMSMQGIEFPKAQMFTTAIASIDALNDETNDTTSDEMLREVENASSNNNVNEAIDYMDNQTIVERLLGECTEDERDIITMMYGIGRREETIASIAAIKKMDTMKVKRLCKKAMEKMKMKAIK